MTYYDVLRRIMTYYDVLTRIMTYYDVLRRVATYYDRYDDWAGGAGLGVGAVSRSAHYVDVVSRTLWMVAVGVGPQGAV